MRTPLAALLLLVVGCDAAVEPVPGAPTALTVERATPTSVTLRWQAPEAPVDGFEIRAGCLADCPALYPDVLATVEPGVRTYTVEGLVDVAPRQFQVVAVGADGARRAAGAVRVAYPGDGVLSLHPLPTAERAYLGWDGEVAFQYGGPRSGVQAVETATGATEPLFRGRSFNYDVIATTRRMSNPDRSTHSALVYDTTAVDGVFEAVFANTANLSSRDIAVPDGPLLFDREGFEGIVVGPPTMGLLVGSYQGPEGPALMGWRAGFSLVLAPDLVAGFESAVPVGATSVVGMLVLLDPDAGSLHGVYLGDPSGPREAWRLDAGWQVGPGVVPQLNAQYRRVAFTAGGHHRVVDASSGQETLAVPAGDDEVVVAIGNAYVAVSDGEGLSFFGAADGRVVRRLPERPGPLDGRVAVGGRHWVTVVDGVATVIVEEGGARAVRRWALDAVWREAPAQ